MKERLDKYLTDLGYFETKSKAAASILAGHVKINDEYGIIMDNGERLCSDLWFDSIGFPHEGFLPGIDIPSSKEIALYFEQ